MIETEGQFRGITPTFVVDPGDTGTSIESWSMQDNDYPRFDPSKSYTQNYGNGSSNNDGDTGTSPLATPANRGR